MTWEQVAALITALGLGTILPELARALWKAISGRVGRERDAVTYERKRANDADKRADDLDRRLDREIALRRAVVAIAARYERQLISLGRDTAELEIWPEELTIPGSQLPARRGRRTERE